MEKNIEVKVGLLVAICIGVLVAFIVILGDYSAAPGSVVYLDVDTSASLKPGATVKVAGVNAGKVAAVDYRGGAVDPAVGRPVYVRIALGIDQAMLATLRRSSRFLITTQGVLGEKYVEIDPGVDDAPLLHDGDILVGEPPLRLEVMALNANKVLATLSRTLDRNEKVIDQMIVDAAGTMASARRTIDRIDTLMTVAVPKVDGIIEKLSGLEDDLKVTVTGVNAAIGDGSELREIVLDVNTISARVAGEIGPIAAEARQLMQKVAKLGGEAEALVAEVKAQVGTMVGNIGGVLTDAKILTQRLVDGQGTIGALLSDREMYDDVREMMKDLKRHPWKFIWKE